MPVNFRPCCNKIIKSQRHQKALEYALEQIRASSIAPYVNAVYLYGSCARGRETWNSDVDLLLELDEEKYNQSELKIELRILKAEVMTDDVKDPETDLKIVVGEEWKVNTMPFYENIRKEGILIWP